MKNDLDFQFECFKFTMFNQKKGGNMKLRGMWVWTKHCFMILIFIGFLFTMGSTKSISNTICVDQDVGITPDDSRELNLTELNFTLIREAEVEISPGDVLIFASSKVNFKTMNEALLGSLNECKNTYIYNESKTNILFYYKDLASNCRQESNGFDYKLFRCDRSKCLMYSENIA